MTYMLAALCWWAVLLQRKNSDIFVLESKLLQERYINDLGIPTVDVTTLSEFTQIKTKHDKQQNMILGESIVFGLVLIMGIYLINRAFNKELSVATRQKNFLLSITHELKSPLASINLILDTFIKRDLPTDKVKELSGDALKESKRLGRLFDKILLTTRLNTADSLNKYESNLSSLVENIVGNFQKLHPEASITTSIQQGILKNIDENAIHSVVTNLLENALKYSPTKTKVHVVLSQEHEKATLAVEDNGIGISAADRTKIFDQFYRVGSEETRTSKGTGLGLYIVKRIVQAHNGKIKVEDSTLGGSTFIITL